MLLTLSPFLPLRPLSCAPDIYSQVSNGHLHQTTQTPQLCSLPKDNSLPQPTSLYSLSCIPWEVPCPTMHPWYFWIHSPPSPIWLIEWQFSPIVPDQDLSCPHRLLLPIVTASIQAPIISYMDFFCCFLFLILPLTIHPPHTPSIHHKFDYVNAQSGFFEVPHDLEERKSGPSSISVQTKLTSFIM